MGNNLKACNVAISRHLLLFRSHQNDCIQSLSQCVDQQSYMVVLFRGSCYHFWCVLPHKVTHLVVIYTKLVNCERNNSKCREMVIFKDFILLSMVCSDIDFSDFNENYTLRIGHHDHYLL